MEKRVVKLLSQSFLPTQGRYPRIYSEALSLKKIGCDVLILGWDRIGNCTNKERIDGIDIERINVKSSEMRGPVQIFFLFAFWFKAFVRLLFEKVDVIHCHNLDVVVLGYLLSKTKRCSVIFDAHEPHYYALWPEKWRYLLGIINRVESFLAKRMNHVIVANNYQLNKFAKMGIENVKILGNYPVDSFIIDKVPEEKFRSPEVVLGRIGTLYPDVGIEEGAIAFKNIMDKHPNARMLLAGRIVEPYRNSLNNAIIPLGSRIKLTGAFDAKQMPKLYQRIDISLMMYKKNDWFKYITPTKFFDSLANGVPVIMTDIGGLGEIIERYNCGIVVDEKDIPGISKAMELLIVNKELRARLSKNGLKLIKEKFNWGKVEICLRNIYEAI